MLHTGLVGLDLAPTERPIRDGLPGLRRWRITPVVPSEIGTPGHGQGAAHRKREECAASLERCAALLRAEGVEASAAPHASGAPAPGLPAAAPLAARVAKHGSPIASASWPAAHAPAPA